MTMVSNTWLTVDQVDEYAYFDATPETKSLLLRSILDEINERFPNHDQGDKYKRLAMQLWELLVRYGGVKKSPPGDYVEKKDRLYIDAGWSPGIRVVPYGISTN